MKPQEYITDQKAFVTSLFEQAFGKRIDYVLKHWKDYLNMVPSGADTLLDMAYLFAQDLDKENLAFYSFLCYWHACRHWHRNSVKMDYYREALRYCQNLEMHTDIMYNFLIAKKLLEKETSTGISQAAAVLIEGVERLRPFYSADSGCLHDAQVSRMAYDRDKNTLEIDIDSKGDGILCTIPFRFSELLRVEADIDYGNDYVWQSRIYEDNGFICVEFESAHLRIASRRLSIGEIRHDS